MVSPLVVEDDVDVEEDVEVDEEVKSELVLDEDGGSGGGGP